MKEIKIQVYEFDELSEAAKEKARDWWKERDDMPMLADYMSEELVQLLKKYRIKYDELPRVFYSLSYSQGDGAMFEGRVQWKKYTAKIKHSGNYYHYNSKNIDLFRADGEYANNTDDYDAFNELYVKICRELERAGYAYIEGERENDTVDENIRANEYTFTKDGKRFII